MRIVLKRKRADGMLLEISDAHEGVEVFVNGTSLGIQIVPTYRYDLSSAVRDGEDELAIEVATTLERRDGKIPESVCEIYRSGCNADL